MVLEEIYLLTKHGRFSSQYIENLAVYKRRFYLDLMKEEADEVRKNQQKSTTTVNRVKGIRRR